MKLQGLLFFIFTPLFIAFTSCHNEEEAVPEECLQSVACTNILMSFSVSVKTQDNEPVALDEYYSENLLTGQKFNFQDTEYDSIRRKLGSYPLLSDVQYDNVKYQGSPIEFVGKIDGQTVVRAAFLIGKDCCHINLISGDTKIRID